MSALLLAAIIWEKCTPPILDRVQNGFRVVLESVVEKGMSSFCWDSDSILTDRMVTRCQDFVKRKDKRSVHDYEYYKISTTQHNSCVLLCYYNVKMFLHKQHI
jgi:hypothetical protein